MQGLFKTVGTLYSAGWSKNIARGKATFNNCLIKGFIISSLPHVWAGHAKVNTGEDYLFSKLFLALHKQ